MMKKQRSGHPTKVKQAVSAASKCFHELTDASILLSCTAREVQEEAVFLLGEVCSNPQATTEAVRSVVKLLVSAELADARADNIYHKEVTLRHSLIHELNKIHQRRPISKTRSRSRGSTS